ncbi:MAG: substrate-binding domain-containing protein, partial [Phycisphaerae bacterium]
LTRHLIELGHTRIAYVDTWWGYEHDHAHHSVGDRRDGYADAIAEAGLEPEWFLLQEATPHEQWQQLGRWLRRPGRPTAVVSYWTADAWPILNICGKLGLQAGRDLSVASFAQPNDAGVYGFGLTVLSQPEASLGHAAVDVLIERMNGARPLPAAVVKGKLIVGETTAAPDAGREGNEEPSDGPSRERPDTSK